MPAFERQVQPVEPVAREVDDEAGLAQALAQVVAGLGLVLDDQDLHACGSMDCAAAGQCGLIFAGSVCVDFARGGRGGWWITEM